MNLYLLRHGEAEPRARDDSERALTPRGRQEIEQVARQFASRQLPLDLCYSSPYVRARQTAEHFLRHSGLKVPLEITPSLVPDLRAAEVLRFLQGCGQRDLLLVSHNPLLSELSALLTAGDISQMQIMATGELVCINLDLIGLGMGTTSFRLLPDKHSNLS